MPRWIAWTLLTLVSWGIWAILSKLIGGGISDAQIQVVSTLGILPILAALFFVPDTPSTGNRRRGIWLAFGSGVISCLGNIAFYAVLTRGAKATAVIPLTDLYPAVTVLLAVPILGERLNRLQWSGILLSLGAIYLFHVAGEHGLMSGWLLLAMVPILLWGVCGLLQKMSTNDISGRTSAIWFLMAFIPVAVLIQLYDPLPSDIAPRTMFVGAAVGFAPGVRQLNDPDGVRQRRQGVDHFAAGRPVPFGEYSHCDCRAG